MLPAPAPCEFDVVASHAANTSVTSEVHLNDAFFRSESDTTGSHENSKQHGSEVPVHLPVQKTTCAPAHVQPNDMEDERKATVRYACSSSPRKHNPYPQE